MYMYMYMYVCMYVCMYISTTGLDLFVDVQLEIDHFRNNSIGEGLHYNTTMVAS